MSAPSVLPVQPEMAHPYDELDVLPVNFGQQALHYDGAYTQHLEGIHDYFAEDSTTAAGVALGLARSAWTMRQLALDAMREGFAGLDESQSRVVGSYLAKLVATKPGLDPHVANPQSLADPERVSDSQLLELARRHDAELSEQRRNDQVVAKIEQRKTELIQREEAGIQAGWISTHARTTFAKIKDLTVGVADIAKVAYGYAGYLVQNNDWLTISQGDEVGEAGVGSMLARIDDVLGHESMHAQFAHELPEWEDEAMAEHTDLMLVTDSLASAAAMDPYDRTRQEYLERNRYVEERRLKYIELTAGLPLLDADTMVRYASLAFTSGSINSPETQLADRLINQSWAHPDMRGYITEKIATFEGEIREEMRQAATGQGAIPKDNKGKSLTHQEIRNEALRRTQSDLLARARHLRQEKTQLRDGAAHPPVAGDSQAA